MYRTSRLRDAIEWLLFVAALVGLCALIPFDARAQPDDRVVVTGKRAKRVSKGATGLPLELKDTPQSIGTMFERIELIRGANGLLTGVGNASGTINYVRKRPQNRDGGEVGLAYGAIYGAPRNVGLALAYPL